jgi:NADH-quinone oxidoreductase subunit L
MHAMGNVIDLRHFSGLRDVMPQTKTLMLIGCLTLAGFPGLSGFWSKDEIVHAAWNWSPWLGGLLMLTAGLTAYYTFRMYFLCFHGSERFPPEAGDHPHEASPTMLRPLYVLAAGSVVLGLLMGVTLTIGNPFHDTFLAVFKPHGYFHHYLESSTVIPAGHHAGGIWIAYASAAIAIFGIGLAWVRYGDAPLADPDKRALGPLFTLLYNKWFVDELYDVLWRRPLKGVGHVCFAIDRYGIDGLVWFVSFVPRAAGGLLRTFQRGALQGYALGMVVGLAVLMALWKYMDVA